MLADFRRGMGLLRGQVRATIVAMGFGVMAAIVVVGVMAVMP